MTPVKQSDQYEELEVEVVEESWNSYDLEDGSRIKARPILTKIFWPKREHDVWRSFPSVLAQCRSVITVFAPGELKGPTNPNPPAVEKALVMEHFEVKVLNSTEKWNKYELPGERGKIKVKLVMSSVLRIKDAYTDDGSPYYLINSTVVVGPSS